MSLPSNQRYRMPFVFGPTVGPRQGPDGEVFDYSEAPRRSASVSFLTDAGVLSRYLPPRCELQGEPVVTVELAELLDLEWLAGRSYSMLGVRFPVAYRGESESVSGPFLAVLWENRPEPILSGREELGFAKLYAQLPPPRVLRGRHVYEASWEGHTFLTMTLSDLVDAKPPQSTPTQGGVLHHRYFPAVSEGGQSIDEMVITPAGGASVTYDLFKRGAGAIEFHRSTWEQLPTMFHIVNALADLPVLEMRGAALVHSRGAKDLSDQRVLR
jgi:hypothetical protein